MTREEILAMNPGRELDKEVALKVMGVKEVTEVGSCYFIEPLDKMLLAYSIDIAAVWEMESTMQKPRIRRVLYTSALRDVILHEQGIVSDFDLIHALPAQRCKAALLAVTE